MRPRKPVYGVGVNDADYVTQKFEAIGYVDGKQKLVWKCPYYRAWQHMIERCYSAKFQERYPTYAGCTVSEEWLTFSVFKSWMEAQDFDGLQLDKDILFEGNKVYSAETCVFVTPMVNTFTTDGKASRGELLIGVSWHKPTEKFIARCRNPFTGKTDYLGLFTCEQQAHNAWQVRKLELAKELASIQSDPRVAKALILKYTNYKQESYEID